jgi:hypothetical protein
LINPFQLHVTISVENKWSTQNVCCCKRRPPPEAFPTENTFMVALHDTMRAPDALVVDRNYLLAEVPRGPLFHPSASRPIAPAGTHGVEVEEQFVA